MVPGALGCLPPPAAAADPCFVGRPLLLRLRFFPTILIVLLAVFNDGAMIALSKDRVSPAPHECASLPA